MTTCSAAQPARDAMPQKTAPARMQESIPAWPRPAQHQSSVAQPTRDAKPQKTANARKVTLKENTPLYDNFLDAMKESDAGKELMDFMVTVCFFRNQFYFDERGNKLSQPRCIGF